MRRWSGFESSERNDPTHPADVDIEHDLGGQDLHDVKVLLRKDPHIVNLFQSTSGKKAGVKGMVLLIMLLLKNGNRLQCVSKIISMKLIKLNKIRR